MLLSNMSLSLLLKKLIEPDQFLLFLPVRQTKNRSFINTFPVLKLQPQNKSIKTSVHSRNHKSIQELFFLYMITHKVFFSRVKKS